MGTFYASISLVSSFQFVDNKQMFIINSAYDCGLNHGPLVSEATILPTEPQPLPLKLKRTCCPSVFEARFCVFATTWW